MLTVLYARGGQEVRRELLERMGRSEAERRLLLVAEQFSHESERAMCAVLGARACQRCEVLSFTRLARRLTDAAGGGAAPVLDGGGRMLLMYAALRQISESLSVYRAPSRKPAFLTELLATVDECRSCRVEPEELVRAGGELEGRQGEKLRDIGLIYQAYRALEESAAADPRSRLDRLSEQLRETGWARGKAFFVFGFTDFTPQEERVLEQLLTQGQVTVALLGDGEEEPDGVFRPAWRAAQRLLRLARRAGVPVREERLDRPDGREASLAFLERHLFGPLPEAPWAGPCAVTRVRGGTPRQEAEWCASEILRLLREEGYRCRDIAVCARRMDRYGELIEGVFERYGVPVFWSGMTDVLQKPVLALVTAALAAAAEDYPYEEMFRYLKTGLTGLSEEDRDLLENYVLTWDIRGGTWTRAKPWDMHPEGYGLPFTEEQSALVARLDEVRREVIAPLEALRRGKDKTGRGRALALYDMMETIGLRDRIAQRADALEGRGELNGAAEYRQLWDILVGALEQCALLLGDAELELEEFSRLFSLVLSQYQVGAIPVSLDRVTVGDAPRMAHRDVKALFLLGADSGSIPDCSPAPGLFSDQDRDALALVEVELTSRQEERLHREMTIAYETCVRPTKRLYVCCPAVSSAGEERTPCFLFQRLDALFPQGPQADPADGLARLWAPDAALELAGRDGTVAGLLRGVPELTPRLERLERAAGWRRGRLSPAAVRSLFRGVVPMSATRLDLYNSCHFSHFLRFGLQAKPRQRAALRPSDYGTFVHAVLEGTLRAASQAGVGPGDREALLRLAQAEADRYEAEVLPGLADGGARLTAIFRQMKRAALAVTESVTEELAASDFTPAAFELGFGRGKELPPVEVKNGVTLRLSGIVDRVDSWVKDGKRYLRVMDYKTGLKSFDFAELKDGRGLQMLLYLFALCRDGAGLLGPEEPVPAGVLYIPARTPVVEGSRGMTDEDIRARRADMLRRQGLVLSDPDVLAAMEHTEGDYRFLPVSSRKRDGLATAEQLSRLDRYVTQVLLKAAGEVARGKIDADPYWEDDAHNACRWCDYRAACHFEECYGDAHRFRKGMSAAEFWRWLSAEEEEQGDGD